MVRDSEVEQIRQALIEGEKSGLGSLSVDEIWESHAFGTNWKRLTDGAEKAGGASSRYLEIKLRDIAKYCNLYS